MLSSAKLFETAQSQLDHDRLMSIINNLTEGFLAVTPEGQIEMSNGVALSLLDTNSLSGKNIKDALPLIDAEQKPHSVLGLVPAGTANFSSTDYRLKYADGKVINLYTNVSAVRS
ncbi:hypothetical protein KW801_03875, partial [Candidatus Saccharibacteria bacterium]|nr:hypothetical protein [Candidatus Saccharibacteria bacterium]